VQTQVDFFPREIITWQVREPITEVEHESRWSKSDAAHTIFKKFLTC